VTTRAAASRLIHALAARLRRLVGLPDRRQHRPQPLRIFQHDRQRNRPGAPYDHTDKPRDGLSAYLPRLTRRGPSRAMKTFVVLLGLAGVAGAQPSHDQADVAFAEGRYEEAIRLYLAAQERDGPSAALHASLADAYAGAGDVGHAVLGYERSLSLAPRAGAVRGRLEDLRHRKGLEDDIGRGWRDFHRYLTRGEWTAVACVAAALLLAAFAGRRRLARPVIARLAALALLTALPAATAITRLTLERHRAIVVSKAEVPLRVVPEEDAEEAGSVRPGQVVWTTRSADGSVRVSTTRGTTGWVPREAVEPISP